MFAVHVQGMESAWHSYRRIFIIQCDLKVEADLGWQIDSKQAENRKSRIKRHKFQAQCIGGDAEQRVGCPLLNLTVN